MERRREIRSENDYRHNGYDAKNELKLQQISFPYVDNFKLKAAPHRIRLRLTLRLMANGSLHTTSVGRIRVNFLGFDRMPAYLKLF